MRKILLFAAATGVVAAMPLVASAHKAGEWIVRGGVATVDPDESSGRVSVEDLGGPVDDTGLGVTTDSQLGLTVTYMFTDNIALEVLASTPFEHDVTLQGSGLSGVAPTGTTIASVEHLPPTVSLQYFFMDGSSPVQPYAGIGINYWLVMDEELSGAAKSALGARSLDVDDSVGLSLQLGVDYKIDEHWLLNAAVWNIDIDTDASFNSDVGKVSAEIEIDPWVYMISVGYTF